MVKRLMPVVLICVPLVFAEPAMAGGSSFGLQSFEVSATEAPPAGHAIDELGPADLQAGSHPYALTTSFLLNESAEISGEEEFLPAGGGPRDVRVELPPGLVGNPNAVPKCPIRVFFSTRCPDDTAVGTATTIVASTHGYNSPVTGKFVDQWLYFTNPVYNVEPPRGVAAELGFFSEETASVLIKASVRTNGDYGITVASRAPQAVVVQGAKVTIWGVPADPSHDRIRGKCLAEPPGGSFRQEIEEGRPHNEEESVRENEEKEGVENPTAPAACPTSTPVQPFLTNPTSCGEVRTATLSVDSWEEPGVFDSKAVALPALVGCEALDFSPTINVKPDGTAGSTPTGLNVALHVPQESTTNPLGLGEADVRDTTVALPEGMQISPSAADGLQACPQLHGGEFQKEERERKGEEVGIDLESGAPANCPDASKLGTVHIKTPLLEHELEGAVYLASPQSFAGLPSNPFSSLIALYLVAEEPAAGVLIKVAGKVTPNLETGQLTTTFENTPQLPFEDLKLEFFGTDRAPLTTPARCGTYTTESSFVPWSGTPAKSPSSSFRVTSGPSGSPCAEPLPFAPSLTAGATNIQAGAFSPFTMTMSREDGQQSLRGVQLQLPAGLLGMLSSVTPCEEPQASEGTCGPGSLIGETTVSVGLGGDPYTVTGGRVYITGPYHGAPYGLSIVESAKAGPFDLENTEEHHPACDCLVVRAKVTVNPITSALTATANSGSEEYAIPTVLEGIPLQIKHVNVTINRGGFTFNPTDCNPLRIGGSLSSAEGASASLQVPFQVTNCGALAFKPTFAASTLGSNSRTEGASLKTTVTYPSTPQGSEANIAKVQVSLPARLPARLSTLRKACTEQTFAENPANCPAASRVGEAMTSTPVLPNPLSGPAYFVSHGEAKYPELIIVLQGDNVTIDLHGETALKKGALIATFNSVPDAPFSRFELNLPEGLDSALTANGANICKAGSLTMPTEIVAQDGAVINQSTKVEITGCPKKKLKHRAKRKGKHKTKK